MTTPTAVFSLRAIVREVIDGSTITDPGEVAAEVDRRVPDEHVREAMNEGLRALVREVFRAGGIPPGVREAPRPGRAPVAPLKGRSAKRKAINDSWKRVLEKRVHVGPDPSAWKLMGDCAYDDLMFMAEERRAIAARTLSRADRYEALADLLKLHGVEQVRELPEEVLVAHLGEGEGQ